MRELSELIDEERIVQKGRGFVLLKGISALCSAEKSVSYSAKENASGALRSLCKEGCKVNLLALGDVGGTVLLGLKLLGGGEECRFVEAGEECGRPSAAPLIDTIGIYDLNEKLLSRYEREINQIYFPDGRKLPTVKILREHELFDCDMFVFCASKGVPPVGESGDVRMMQLEANKQLVEFYARKAIKADFKGIFAVVSDPVDPLCKAAVVAGLKAEQVQGYGLGVMNARAMYFTVGDDEFKSYRQEGRAFGPHGEDLVIANSIKNYDDEVSQRLTQLTVNSNMDTRADGFKPYIAPAISSGAISLTATLKGSWNYSSVYFGKGQGGAFLGCRNRRHDGFIEIEDLPLDDKLYARIERAYNNLRDM